MKRIFTLLMSASLASLTYSQEVQKCCGTSSSTFLLGNMSYAAHTQCLYAPGDFTGAAQGSIIKLYYRYGNSGVANGNTIGDLTISMLQTSATAFSGETFLTGLQTVLNQSTFTIAPGNSGDWFSFDLDTPFVYDPSLSLVVDIRMGSSANTAFGTMAVSNATGRKIMSSSTTSPTGESWDTLQDLGFDLDQTSGTSDRMSTAIKLFPNPAGKQVCLYLPDMAKQRAILELFGPTGRVVLQQTTLPEGSTRAVIDLDRVPAGLYLVQVHSASGITYSGRLVRE